MNKIYLVVKIVDISEHELCWQLILPQQDIKGVSKLTIFKEDTPALVSAKVGDDLVLVCKPEPNVPGNENCYYVWYFIHNGIIYHYTKIEAAGILNSVIIK